MTTDRTSLAARLVTAVALLGVAAATAAPATALAAQSGGARSASRPAARPAPAPVRMALPTRVLPPAAVRGLTGKPDTGQQLLLQPGTPPPAVGQVVVSAPGPGAPAGLLGRVVRVTPGPAGPVVALRFASLPDAVPAGAFHTAVRLGATGPLGAGAPRGARLVTQVVPPHAARSLVALPALNVAFGPVHCGGSAQVALNGHLTLHPQLDLDGSIEIFPHPGVTASVSASLDEDADVTAGITGTASCSTRVPLLPAPLVFGPVTFFIGPVPVVFTVQLQLYLDANGHVSGSLTTHVRQHLGMAMSAGVDHGNAHFSSSLTKSLSVSTPVLSGNAGLEVGAGPQIDLLLYGFAGPRLVARGYIGANADSTAYPAWSVYAGLTAGLRFTVPVFGIDVGKNDILSERWTLAQALGVTTGSVPSAVSGASYSQQLGAVGGSGGGYTWAVTGGALPAGLTLSSSGLLSGVPQAVPSPTTTTVTVTVRDSAGGTSSRPLSVTVQPTPALSVAGPDLEEATVGMPYADQLTARGGYPPYTWRVTGGSLPHGLQFHTDGSITGRPLALGTSAFTVQVTDASGAVAGAATAITVQRREGPGHCLPVSYRISPLLPKCP